jgi:hypothetical protein
VEARTKGQNGELNATRTCPSRWTDLSSVWSRPSRAARWARTRCGSRTHLPAIHSDVVHDVVGGPDFQRFGDQAHEPIRPRRVAFVLKSFGLDEDVQVLV